MSKRRQSLLFSLLVASGLAGGCVSDEIMDLEGTDMGAAPSVPPKVPRIKHVVLIIQENHTFDNYFGRYCTAPAGSNPTCTDGPACCERAPDREPGSTMAAPVSLTDAANASHDPNHSQACELAEANGGKMDRYVTGAPGCSDARNWGITPSAIVQPYHDFASQYALADRYFQPLSGQSSANDMYFAVAKFVFKDNDIKPDSVGKGCWAFGLYSTVTKLQGVETLGDLLVKAGKSFATYAMGYRDMKTAKACPGAPSDCTSTVPTFTPNPCWYDPSDFPFQYYAQFTDNDTYMKDYAQLKQDIASGQLPSFAFVKASSYKDEHPGFGTTITNGVNFVKQTVTDVMSSAYADDTLILVTWDEGGGYFDHVSPPGNGPVDNQPYGTRVPLLAIGRFAKKNFVSHVQLEHSSIVKFLEYNFLGEKTGQLKGRDAVVNNIGSLLDPSQTGIVIPEN